MLPYILSNTWVMRLRTIYQFCGELCKFKILGCKLWLVCSIGLLPSFNRSLCVCTPIKPQLELTCQLNWLVGVSVTSLSIATERNWLKSFISLNSQNSTGGIWWRHPLSSNRSDLWGCRCLVKAASWSPRRPEMMHKAAEAFIDEALTRIKKHWPVTILHHCPALRT